MNKIGIVGFNPCSVCDGVGLREVIYVGQCTHNCLGCHNRQYWEDKGTKCSIDSIVNRVIQNPLTNITISGGDGLTIQYEATLKLLKEIKAKSNKNIWVYTGYTFQELLNDKKEVLNYIDVLVDGKFEIDKKDLTLKFKGSSNQNCIDVVKSLQEGKMVLYDI